MAGHSLGHLFIIIIVVTVMTSFSEVNLLLSENNIERVHLTRTQHWEPAWWFLEKVRTSTSKLEGVIDHSSVRIARIWIGWDEEQEATEDRRSWWIRVAKCVVDARWTMDGTKNQDRTGHSFFWPTEPWCRQDKHSLRLEWLSGHCQGFSLSEDDFTKWLKRKTFLMNEAAAPLTLKRHPYYYYHHHNHHH